MGVTKAKMVDGVTHELREPHRGKDRDGILSKGITVANVKCLTSFNYLPWTKPSQPFSIATTVLHNTK